LTHAHGYLASVTIDGAAYIGNPPNFTLPSIPSAIRQVGDVIPINSTDSLELSCGIKAKPAELILKAKPGSVVEFDWEDGDKNHVSSYTFFDIFGELIQFGAVGA
jgi:hypothetical protein